MKFARTVNGQLQVGTVFQLFPNTSFPPSGPNATFIQEQGLVPVVSSKPFNPDYETLVPSPPYVENGVVYDVQVQAAPLATRRASVWELAKAERARRVNGGVQVNSHWFHTDNDSRIQFLRLDQKATNTLAAGGQLTDQLTVAGTPILWKTYDNGLIPMTVQLAQQIALAIEILDAQAFARGETLRAMIYASTSPESIDIYSGWPEIYTEGA